MFGLFLELDILGEKPKLKINQHYSYKNYFGSSISLLIIILLSILVIYFSIQVLNRTRSNIVYSVLHTNTPPPLYLSSNNFTIAVSMETPDFNYYIDDSIYTIKAVAQYENMENGKWNYKAIPINLKKCKLDYFPMNYRDLLNEKSIENMLCTKMNESFIFHGTFPSGKQLELYFYFSQCYNTTSNNNTCKSQDVIDYYLDGNYLQFLYTEISIDPSNITNPDQVLIGDLFRMVSNKYLTNILQTLKNVIIESDYGIIYESDESRTFVQTDHIDTSYIFSKQSKYFTSYVVQLSPTINIYKRSYTKIHEIAAQIGGVFNFLLICGNILTRSLRKVLYFQYLTNNMFEFEDQEPIGGINLNLSHFFSKKNLKENELSAKSFNNRDEKSVSKINNEEKEANNHFRKFKLEINAKEIIFVIFCKFMRCIQNEKLNFIDQFQVYAENFLNVEFIIQNFEDLKKIKSIIFDYNEKRLLENSSKPVIKGYDLTPLESKITTNLLKKILLAMIKKLVLSRRIYYV